VDPLRLYNHVIDRAATMGPELSENGHATWICPHCVPPHLAPKAVVFKDEAHRKSHMINNHSEFLEYIKKQERDSIIRLPQKSIIEKSALVQINGKHVYTISKSRLRKVIASKIPKSWKIKSQSGSEIITWRKDPEF